MTIRNITVALRNTTGSPISMGTFIIGVGNTELIWDAVNYIDGTTDNLEQVLTNIATYNEGIQNGDLVQELNSVDQSASEAFATFRDLQAAFQESSIKDTFAILRLESERTKGLQISYNAADFALSEDFDIDGYDIINVGNVDGRDVSADGSTLDSHVVNTSNPHSTDLGNLGSGTLTELNSIVTDATLDDSSDPRTPTTHAGSHITGAGDEIDGDQIDIDWNPSNYTPTTSPTEVTSLDHLTAHLAGIDSALGTAVTDHGGLTGLGDDDHTQYLLADGTRAMTGALNMGSNNITSVGLVDGVDVSTHASRHNPGGADALSTDTASTLSGSNAEGSSGSFARSDHNHALGGTVGGDLSGTLPNPTVTDLTISGEEEGSILYFDGVNWVNLPPGDDGYILQSNGDGYAPTWTANYEAVIDVYNSAGGGSIDTTPVYVPFDSTRRVNENVYSHDTVTNNTEVTVNETGVYRITAQVGTNISSGSSRSASEMWVEVDDGGGFVEIAGTRGIMYNREQNEGGTHASRTFYRNLISGDKIRIGVQRIASSNTLTLQANNSSLLIEKRGGVQTISVDVDAISSPIATTANSIAIWGDSTGDSLLDTAITISSNDIINGINHLEADNNSGGVLATTGAIRLTEGGGNGISFHSDNANIEYLSGQGRLVLDSTRVTIHSTDLQLETSDIFFIEAQTAPTIRHEDEDDSSSSENLTIQAQNNTFTTSTGGSLILTSGSGTSASGDTILQSGGVDAIRVDDNTSTTLASAEDGYVLSYNASTNAIEYVPSLSGASDHGSLTGLGDDDHTQYLLVGGTRAMSGALDMGTNNITNVGTVDGRNISADGTALDSHIANTANPHSTDIGNLGSGTLAELNSIISDATLGDLTSTAPVNVEKNTAQVGVSSEVARADHRHDIDTGTPATLTVGQTGSEGISSSLARADHDHQVIAGTPVAIGDANSAGALNSFVRSDHVHALGGSVGGDLSGTLPNPTVTDLTITSEAQGSVLYFNGLNWVQLSPGTSGQVLETQGAGANPIWSNASSGDVIGPVSHGDNEIPRWNGSNTGTLQSSSLTIDDDGNIYLDANGSSTASPRILGANNFTTGEAIAWQFGDDSNVIQNSNGGSMTLYAYHTIVLRGGRGISGGPGFDTESDIGVWMPNTTATSPALVIDGASSQSADLQQWRSNTPATLLSIDSSGNIVMAGAQTVDGRDVSADGTTLDTHVANTANPHGTDIGNLGSGTLAELNAAVTDATLDDAGDSRTPTGSAGGDLGGTYPNPTVTDLTITSEVQGSILYFNGLNWVQLSPGTSGQVLETQGAGANPIWSSVAGGVTDHGALTGLGDDDHTQYLLVNGTRAMSGSLNMGTNAITNVGNIDGVDVSSHASRHISGGTDEIDGDQVDIDWNPSSYTPSTSPTEVTSVNHLTAHLAGIDSSISIFNSHLSDQTNPHSTSLTNLVDTSIGTPSWGSILYRGSSLWEVLAEGASGQFLQTQGSNSPPQWADVSADASNVVYDPSSSYLVATDMQGAVDEMTALNALTQEPSGFPNRTDSSISKNDGTRTFTIQPSVTSYDIYIKGEKITKSSAENVVWTDVEGLHFFGFDNTGTLIHSTTESTVEDWILGNGAFISAIYWDAANNQAIFWAEERHGLMDGETHLHFHTGFGAQWTGGGEFQNIISNGDGSSNSHAQFSVENVSVADEDLRFSYTDGSPQDLSPIAQIPIYYRSGVSGDWRKKTATDYPFIESGTAGYTGGSGLIAYNEYTGATWQLTEVTNNNYVLVHYFVSDEINEPVIGILGQKQYSTLSAANSGAADDISYIAGIQDLFAQELAVLGTVIFNTSNSYTNTPKAVVNAPSSGVDYFDYRAGIISKSASSSASGGASGVQSFPIGICDTTAINVEQNDAIWGSLVIPLVDVTIGMLEVQVTQAAIGNVYCAIYDESFNLISGDSTGVSVGTTGVKISSLDTVASLTAGTSYYLCARCDANGSRFSGTATTSNVAVPQYSIRKDNGAPSSFPSSFSSPATNTDILWILAIE